MKTRNANELDRGHKTAVVGKTLRLLAYIALSLASQCVVRVAHADNAINIHPVTFRIPFLFKSRSHKSSTKVYIGHLQNELKATQRQLYMSHQTCTTLRKRVDEQRKEILTRRDMPAASFGSEEDRNRIIVQDEESALLKSQLESELQKVEKQTEHIALLEAELKKVQKSREEKLEDKLRSQLYGQKEEEYKREVEMLKLKLEAAELAAMSQKRTDSDESEEVRAGVLRRRAEQLKIELENVRKRYAKLSIQIAKTFAANMEESSEDLSYQHQKQLEAETDYAIQLAVQTALESIEEEWKEKFQFLQRQLNNATHYTTKVEDERDAALSRLEELLSCSTTNEQQEKLREELTDELTAELTDKITKKLTEELTTKIEKRLRKKYKKLQQELHSKESNMDQNQLNKVQAEILKMKEQYESEYSLKLQHLQQQKEEQEKVQKDRMRKLVRALLERESLQTKKIAQTTENDLVRSNAAGYVSSFNRTRSVNRRATSPSKKNEKERTDGSTSDQSSIDAGLARSPTMPTVSSNKGSPPGVVHVRGNTALK